ncbi:MAG: LysM peptidoglycan-binding domain-containing protein [Chloroflexota bacterium]
MNKRILFWLLSLAIISLILTACEINRPEGAGADLEPSTGQNVAQNQSEPATDDQAADLTPDTEATTEPVVEATIEPAPDDTTTDENSQSTVEATTEPVDGGAGDGEPTAEPTSEPTAEATAEPTDQPVENPTAEPTEESSDEPVVLDPTAEPTVVVTVEPPTPTPEPTPIPTAVPPVTQLPQGGTLGVCHRVVQNDTLYSLAQTHGTDVYAIQLANDLYSDHLYLHQALFIPTALGTGPNFYVVQAGDTLTSIADTCYLPIDFLAWVNDLSQESILSVGHILEIPRPPFPSPAELPHHSNAANPPSVYPPIYSPSPTYGGCDYVVAYGDTLYSIARYYGLSPQVLAQVNGLHNPDHIHAGQCLTIP